MRLRLLFIPLFVCTACSDPQRGIDARDLSANIDSAVDLSGTDLRGADLATHDLSSENTDFSVSIDFGGIDLSAEDLSRPDAGGACSDSSICAAGQFCEFTANGCVGPGTCQPFPGACPQIASPVCGCDGNSYTNSCYAYLAGQNISHTGTCH